MKTQIYKALFIIVFLALLPSHLCSQVRFGIRGSVHRTNISKVHWESVGRTAGSLGGVIQIPLGYDNQFFFQPEVLYSLEGEKDDGDSHGILMRQDYFQNYVNIPLMFRAYFSESDNEFFGELGPQIGILVYEKSKKEDRLNYSKPESLNLSIGAGIGYSFLRKYEISIRYNYGLTDVYKKYPEQQRTSNLGVALTYMFE
ncbi:porin family protein [Apibacter raozihei]|uniref:porin family protein n=1 Tax=Apibacter raozihei TaxID=2500547 RepID=UPI000FE41DA1|nr:porin family protein [Apibacter raozihei]